MVKNTGKSCTWSWNQSSELNRGQAVPPDSWYDSRGEFSEISDNGSGLQPSTGMFFTLIGFCWESWWYSAANWTKTLIENGTGETLRSLLFKFSIFNHHLIFLQMFEFFAGVDTCVLF